jgi:hypothetical protein
MLPVFAVTSQPPRAYPSWAATARPEEESMRRKLLWGLLALALGAPAVWAGTMAVKGSCPVPCEDCPVPCDDCP